MKKEVIRPWGKFNTYAFNEKCTVKIITVNKGEILSLQKHKHRSETWIAIDSGLVAQVGNKKFKLKIGQRINISKHTKHRISSTKKARFLEVSFGKFDENDEIRLEDKYGRVK